jgi:hypothetical protein
VSPRTSTHRLAAVGLLVVLAGCAAAPTAQTTDVSVTLSNDHDDPYRVTLSLVAGDYRSVVVTDADGSTRRVDAASVDDIPRSALDDAVGFAPAGPAVDSAVYDLPPGAAVGDTYADAPRDVTLVYAVGRPGAATPDETLRSYGSVTCGPGSGTLEFDLAVGADGALAVSTACSD